MASRDNKVLNGIGLYKLVDLFKKYIGIPYTLSGEDTDTSISSGSNLNDYTTIGNYYCQTTSASSNISNNPTSNAFILKIYSGSGRSLDTSSGNYLTQYLEDSTGASWRRYKTTGSWSDWERIVLGSTDTIGSGTNPIYISDGKITSSTSTVGSGTNPVYFSSGKFTASTSTVGSSTKPVYLKSGTLTECNDIGTSESLTVTKSTQSNRNITVDTANGYDSSITSGSGKLTGTRYLYYTKVGVSAGTYTVGNLLQQLTNMSHTHETVKDTYNYNCNCNCNCDSDSDHDSI